MKLPMLGSLIAEDRTTQVDWGRRCARHHIRPFCGMRATRISQILPKYSMSEALITELFICLSATKNSVIADWSAVYAKYWTQVSTDSISRQSSMLSFCSGNGLSMMSGEAPHDRPSHFRRTQHCEPERILKYAGPVSATVRCAEEGWLAWSFLVEAFFPPLALRLSLASVSPSSCRVPPCTLHPSSPMLALASSFSSSGMFRRLEVEYTASGR